MAKKKRRITEEPEEEYDFTPEEFDEREFILKDVYGTKVLFIITILSVLVGLLAATIYGLFDGASWVAYLDTVIAFAFVFAMKPLLMAVGFRVDLLEAKTMYGNYLIFLCLALGSCIVFINAPFMA